MEVKDKNLKIIQEDFLRINNNLSKKKIIRNGMQNHFGTLKKNSRLVKRQPFKILLKTYNKASLKSQYSNPNIQPINFKR